MIDKFKSTTFKQLDFEEWEDIAVKSLRGKPLEELTTKTAEGIDLMPLYTREQLENYSYDDSMKMINTVRTEQTEALWTIAQFKYATTGAEYLEQLQDSLTRGIEAIAYDGNRHIVWEDQQLKELAKLIQEYPVYAMNLDENDKFITIFEDIPMESRKHVKGAVSGDSVALPKGYEHVRTVCADTSSVHNRGADSVTELAVTLAKAADFTTLFDNFKEFEKKFYVRFSIDTHFFMEIAKVRAFRVLWRTFSEAYGETDHQSVPVFAENSLRSYSKLDPYVNLLRAGNEALSAVLGGVDVLAIHPHDVLTGVTPTSRRLARNVQLVIKEETLVNQVVDPAGGSYFIDILTKELIEKAWALFQEIELKGGYEAYISSGDLQNRLESLQDYRKDQMTKNEKSLIGTNVYADLSTPVQETKGSIQVDDRLAEPYEALRTYFEKEQPKIILLTFGELIDFKPRADFVSGFLATGGLESEWSPAFSTVEEAHQWMSENKFDYGVVCAGASETEQFVNEFVKNLSASDWIDVAGKYEQEIEKKWLNLGINGFIYKGQDQLEKLLSIKNNWKGE